MTRYLIDEEKAAAIADIARHREWRHKNWISRSEAAIVLDELVDRLNALPGVLVFSSYEGQYDEHCDESHCGYVLMRLDATVAQRCYTHIGLLQDSSGSDFYLTFSIGRGGKEVLEIEFAGVDVSQGQLQLSCNEILSFLTHMTTWHDIFVYDRLLELPLHMQLGQGFVSEEPFTID